MPAPLNIFRRSDFEDVFIPDTSAVLPEPQNPVLLGIQDANIIESVIGEVEVLEGHVLIFDDDVF